MKKTVQKIIDTIHENGGKAYLVGGCVRDLILGRKPNDYDIATNLMPEKIIAMFKKVVPTGIKHLTVTVLENGYPFEVTTYRSDADYSDGRHPNKVTPAKTLIEDLQRRDFTMNALAMKDVDGEVIDYFNGLNDIKNKIIRCVGNCKERFDEDKLRALRAIRFSAQLNFALDKDIFTALVETSLEQISRERIRAELIRILMTNHPAVAFEVMYGTGILKQIIPELIPMKDMDGGKYHDETIWDHTFSCLQESTRHTKKWQLRLAALLHDIGKPPTFTITETGAHFYGHEKAGVELAGKIMRRLKFSNSNINYVKTMVRWHMSTYTKLGDKEIVKKRIKRAVRNIGEENLWDMMILNYCDDVANLKVHTPSFNTFVANRTIWFKWQEIKKLDSALKVTDLAVNGYDMIKLGYREKQIGQILNGMLDKVDSDELSNDREALLDYALIVKMGSNIISNPKIFIPDEVKKLFKAREEYKGKICEQCGLPIDLCVCDEIKNEIRR